jgi:hypothetical protein
MIFSVAVHGLETDNEMENEVSYLLCGASFILKFSVIIVTRKRSLKAGFCSIGSALAL